MRRHVKSAAVAMAAALIAGAAVSGSVRAGSAPAATAASSVPVYLNTDYSFAERAADLVSRMTLAEKVSQLSTSSAPAIPRLGVQQYNYWNEGAHGIRYLGNDTNHGNASADPSPGTSFPTNFASTMTWDPTLMYNESSAISDEIRGSLDPSLWGVAPNNLGPASSDYGALTFWAPTVNMDRDPRWGRTDEAFGEDPYLVGQMAGQFVNGYQGNTMSGQSATGYLKAVATAKHYALNNQEATRKADDSVATDTDIRDYYTAQFKPLIENDHVAGMMTSYNAVNGTPAVADTYTLNQIAHDTYGFDGYVTSDCGGVTTEYRNSPNGHDWAPPGWTSDNKDVNATWTNNTTGVKISAAAGAEAYSLRAGNALNCDGGENTLANVQAAISAGILSEGVIDNALVRVFTVRMATGEFNPAGSVSYTGITKAAIQSPAHQSLATTVADNSLVLLKNNNVAGTSAPLLPVKASALNKVVILGDMADTVTLGGYSGVAALQVNAVQGITAAVHAANPNAQITFDAAGTSSTAGGAAVLSAATQADVKAADLVIVFVGTNLNNAQENVDRSLAMPGNYDSLIDQTAALGNPRMALVIQSAGPVKIDDEQGKFPAVVFSGYNGESQGTALADVLTGKQNPSGHLDFTWYKDDTQLPGVSNYGLIPASTGGLGRTYQYFTGTPTYPFGYGLSYTNFSYSAATVDKSSVTADGTVNVSFTVKNTGSTAGATVAQLYAATPNVTAPTGTTAVTLPVRRLAGFQKTSVLAAGASQQITIPVKISDLSFWDATAMKSVVYDGSYQFQVASAAGTTLATASVAVTGAITPVVQSVTVQPENVVYNPGATFSLTGKNRWLADDTTGAGSVAQGRNLNVTADNVVEAVDNDESFVDLSKATVTYASSNTAVATVSSTGTVTAVAAGTAAITVTVSGVSGTMPVVVAAPSAATTLAAAFDDAGISDDTNTTAGNLDGSGASLSAQALAAAGLASGAAFAHDGVTFTWPDTASGTVDNVVADGQDIQVSGSGTALGFLGLSTYGDASGTGTITYNDGTTQSYTLGFANWWSATASAGSDIAATMPYLDNTSGKVTHAVNLYAATVPLQAGKTVSSVTLPNAGTGAGQTPAMHIFAVGVANLNGTHTLVTSGKALDDPNSSTATGVQLDTWGVNGGQNQRWVFTQQSDGSYQITNASSKLCLDDSGNSGSAGGVVIQWTCSGASNQRWIVTPLSGGGYTVTNQSSRLLLTTSSTATDGGAVTQQTDTGSALQHWTIS